MKVLNLGSLNVDRTYQVEHLVEPKETIKTVSYQEHCGGKGLNQSVALAKGGACVYHAGMVGQDGAKLLRTLESAGVHTELIRQTEVPSGHAVIQVDEKGQNSIIIFGGANDEVTKAYIDAALETFGAGDLLLLQNEVTNVDYAIEKAKARGVQVAFNPSPFDERISKCRLDLIDYFILNEIEARLLAQTDTCEPAEITEKLPKKYPAAAFIVTFGEKGSYYIKGEEQVYQPIFKVPVRDTTGAGDTYCGFFLSGLARGLSIEENLRRASAASAMAVTKKGASNSIPSQEETELFLKQHTKKNEGDSALSRK